MFIRLNITITFFSVGDFTFVTILIKGDMIFIDYMHEPKSVFGWGALVFAVTSILFV